MKKYNQEIYDAIKDGDANNQILDDDYYVFFIKDTLEDKATLKQRMDMAGWIQFAEEKGITPEQICVNLMHDIGGIMRGDECFLPRTNGYAKFLKEGAVR